MEQKKQSTPLEKSLSQDSKADHIKKIQAVVKESLAFLQLAWVREKLEKQRLNMQNTKGEPFKL